MRNMKIHFLILTVLFFVFRLLVVQYDKMTYFNILSLNQFSIAEAAYKGHWFSWDKIKNYEMRKTNELVPIEAFKDYEDSGKFETFQASDTPGLAYLIYSTSKLFGGELTSKYELFCQSLAEFLALALFLILVAKWFGEPLAVVCGYVYLFFFPYVWPLVVNPLSDVYAMLIYSLGLFSVYLFRRFRGMTALGLMVPALLLASVLLWVRPSPYYYFFLVWPLFFFAREKTKKEKAVAALLFLLVPLLVFGQAFKSFNLKYFGVSNTYFLGTQIWEGLGYAGDNKYGCVINDQALLPWVNQHGYAVTEYASPEMNKALWDTSLQIIRNDPGFYLKALAERVKAIAVTPISIGSTDTGPLSFKESGLSLARFIQRYPALTLYKAYFNFVTWHNKTGKLFCFLGLLSLAITFAFLPAKRFEVFLLMTPLIYVFLPQVFIYSEPRYGIVGAWTFILPMAWALSKGFVFVQKSVFEKMN